MLSDGYDVLPTWLRCDFKIFYEPSCIASAAAGDRHDGWDGTQRTLRPEAKKRLFVQAGRKSVMMVDLSAVSLDQDGHLNVLSQCYLSFVVD